MGVYLIRTVILLGRFLWYHLGQDTSAVLLYHIWVWETEILRLIVSWCSIFVRWWLIYASFSPRNLQHLQSTFSTVRCSMMLSCCYLNIFEPSSGHCGLIPRCSWCELPTRQSRASERNWISSSRNPMFENCWLRCWTNGYPRKIYLPNWHWITKEWEGRG